MKCKKARKLLSLYIDNMLDESKTKKVEKHLSACGDCRKEYNEINEALDLLGQAEMVPVPEAFQFRLKNALKEEKRKMVEEGVIVGKPSVKHKWRVITSVAAVFAVAVLSFGLYNHILPVMPDQFAANDQAGTAQTESSAAGKGKAGSAAAEQAERPAAGSGETNLYGTYSAGEDRSASVPDTAGTEAAKNEKRASADGSAAPQEAPQASAPTVSPQTVTAEDEGADAETGGASGQDAQNGAKMMPFSGDTSRSMTSSGVERQADSEEYYNALLEEKLKDFDYQVLGAEYTESGEWQFRVFIFHGEDGNTYNEEILIIGKEGKLEAVYTNENMGL
jgi:anti-sigma factor RsiW